jgi:hypothetical protein
MCRHGKAGDFPHLWRVVIDRQRHPIISCQVGGFLGVQTADEVECQTLARVTDRRRLWPAVWSQRGYRHDPVLIQKC